MEYRVFDNKYDVDVEILNRRILATIEETCKKTAAHLTPEEQDDELSRAIARTCRTYYQQEREAKLSNMFTQLIETTAQRGYANWQNEDAFIENFEQLIQEGADPKARGYRYYNVSDCYASLVYSAIRKDWLNAAALALKYVDTQEVSSTLRSAIWNIGENNEDHEKIISFLLKNGYTLDKSHAHCFEKKHTRESLDRSYAKTDARRYFLPLGEPARRLADIFNQHSLTDAWDEDFAQYVKKNPPKPS